MATKRNFSEGRDAFDKYESPPRINDEPTPSFSNLPNDFHIHMLTFLGPEDMNTFAECNRDCYEIRATESLDHARTGTLLWTNQTRNRSFCEKLRQVQERFTGNRKRLKVIVQKTNTKRNRLLTSEMQRLTDGLRLPEVTRLACSSGQGGGSCNQMRLLNRVLPNLQEVVLTGFSTKYDHRIDGNEFSSFNSLTHLCLDGCKFVESSIRDIVGCSRYMMMKCRRLERLSIKGAKLDRNGHQRSLPQDMLIEMVRCHPTLRWLRSDLSEENAAILQQERPGITFTS